MKEHVLAYWTANGLGGLKLPPTLWNFGSVNVCMLSRVCYKAYFPSAHMSNLHYIKKAFVFAFRVLSLEDTLRSLMWKCVFKDVRGILSFKFMGCWKIVSRGAGPAAAWGVAEIINAQVFSEDLLCELCFHKWLLMSLSELVRVRRWGDCIHILAFMSFLNNTTSWSIMPTTLILNII